MDKHATAKHTDDKHHVLGKHTAFKHKIYDAVISYIDNQGVYRIVYCPSMRYKPAIQTIHPTLYSSTGYRKNE